MVEVKKKVVVIGGGPGGYVAAIRCAQLGCEVSLVEEKNVLGGTCLNIGCIPTKVLLHTSKLFSELKDAEDLGIIISEYKVNMKKLQARKTNVISRMTSGISMLMRSNGINVIQGHAKFISPSSIIINSTTGAKQIEADAFIIATGSVPAKPSIPGIDLENVLNSTELLNIEEVPKSLFILGAGVIGMEFASIFTGLGSSVTIGEIAPHILPGVDREISSVFLKHIQQKVKIYTSTKIIEFIKSEGSISISLQTENSKTEVKADKVLVCTGRIPNHKDLGLEAANVVLDGNKIKVNEFLKTSNPNIYAIGDCSSKIMLAHVASREGEVAAENISGMNVRMDYKTCPAAVFTDPEIACVGLTEDEANNKGIEVQIGRFPLMANGKSVIENGGVGLIKIIIDKKYNEILGLHMIGPRVTDMISEGALALRLETVGEEILSTIHPHPTVSEAIREAVQASMGGAISVPKLSVYA